MEVGYWMGAEFTGRGYMTRAVTALTQYALDNLGFPTIFAKVVKGNHSSLKVLERAGYHLIGGNPENPEEVILEFP